MEKEVNNNETAAVSNKPLRVKRLTPASTVLLTLFFFALVLITVPFIINIIK